MKSNKTRALLSLSIRPSYYLYCLFTCGFITPIAPSLIYCINTFVSNDGVYKLMMGLSFKAPKSWPDIWVAHYAIRYFATPSTVMTSCHLGYFRIYLRHRHQMHQCFHRPRAADIWETCVKSSPPTSQQFVFWGPALHEVLSISGKHWTCSRTNV